MREIKFRAYHFGACELMYDNKPGDVLVWKNQGQLLSDVMQYTGLKDKNGVEIYEGDILKNTRHNQLLKVIWQEAVETNSPDGVWWMKEKPGFRFELVTNPRGMTYVFVSEVLEVIGNIYEHPHLLEGVAE